MSDKSKQGATQRGWWENYCERFGDRIAWFIPIWLISWVVNLLYYPTISNPIQAETFPRVSLLPLGWACLWYVLLCLISSKWVFRVCASFVAGVYIFASIVDLFLFEVYNRVFDSAIAQIFLSTNQGEAEEFWTTKVSLSSILIPLAYVLGAILIAWGVARIFKRIKGWLRSVIVGGAVVVAGGFVSGIYPLLVLRHWPDDVANAVLTSPERLYRGFYIAMRDAEIIQKQLAVLQKTKMAPITGQDSLPAHNVVLVIGESLRPDFMSVYGYKRPTTPKLDSLNKAGELYVFEDVASSASATNTSIVNMMSTYTIDQAGKGWYETPLLNRLASHAGYHTYWLSMQESQGIYIALIASIARLSDELKYLNGVDGNILPHLKDKSQITDKSKKNLFQICHLYGSHEAYVNRYPKEFARFKASDMSEYPEENQKELTSQYLNTIYYNDYVIAEMIKRYKNEPTLLIYLSDHAQAIYDEPGNEDLIGHSLSIPGVRVPMLCYVSPSLRAAAPQLVERIERGIHRSIMSDALTPSILGILGIKSDDYNPRYDFTSEAYEERERKITEGGKTIIVPKLKK